MTPYPSTRKPKAAVTGACPLDPEELRRPHAWWRACNYTAITCVNQDAAFVVVGACTPL